MGLRLPTPTTRAGSTFKQFKARIPADIRSKATGLLLAVPVDDGAAAQVQITEKTKVVQFSLRTRDPVEAKVREVAALAHLNGVWQSLRDGPRRLTHRQVVAISGEAYRRLVSRFEDDPGTPDRWEWFQSYITHVGELILQPPETVPGQTTTTGQELLDQILAERGLVLDQESVADLLHEYRARLLEVAERLRANAAGDYRPDPNLQRFPSVDLGPAIAGRSRGSEQLTLTELLESWWTERRMAGTARSTYTNYRSTIRHLTSYLGHERADQVTDKDIVGYKDHRLAQGRSIKTVKDTDLSGLKSLFGWAVANRKLSVDPTVGIRLKPGRTIVGRQKWFTDEEAAAILRGALSVERGQDSEKTWLAKRWAPWLMAYSGARVGEIAHGLHSACIGRDDHVPRAVDLLDVLSAELVAIVTSLSTRMWSRWASSRWLRHARRVTSSSIPSRSEAPFRVRSPA